MQYLLDEGLGDAWQDEDQPIPPGETYLVRLRCGQSRQLPSGAVEVVAAEPPEGGAWRLDQGVWQNQAIWRVVDPGPIEARLAK